MGDFWFAVYNTATVVQIECEIKNGDLYSNETRVEESPWHVCRNSTMQFRMSLKT